MKFFSSLAALATLATAATIKRDSPLDVKLESIGNTGLQATITNTGSDSLKIFKTGSILDKAPVEKIQVFKGGEPLSCQYFQEEFCWTDSLCRLQG